MKVAVIGATGVVGRHLVAHLRAANTDVVECSRTSGVDVTTGTGLAAALDGVERIVDVCNSGSTDEAEATAFFESAAAQLQAAGERCGAKWIIVLSTVGIDCLGQGYWAAKRAHERACSVGAVPVSILRSTQFHEFAGQVLGWARHGNVVTVTEMAMQPIAAESAAAALAELVWSQNELPARSEVAGPLIQSLFDMARRLAARHNYGVYVQGVRDTSPDGVAIAGGALLATPQAKILGPTFDHWLGAGERLPRSARR